MPSTRARAVVNLAQAVANEKLDLSAAADPSEQVRILQSLPGIGPWTASYIAMRCLADPDAFLETDLVLLKALEKHEGRLTPRQLLRRAERWRPWRAYAALHLWTDAAAATHNGRKKQ